MKRNFTVAGNILTELSENIPSIQFAFAELIKNSYDANAKECKISYDEDKLVISDNGIGFSDKDIQSFLHVSSSEKTYATKNPLNPKRTMQGQKGLGAYAVFKLGNLIQYTSISDGIKRTWELNYETLVNSYNLSDSEFEVVEEKTTDPSGTIITIKELNDRVVLFFQNSHKQEALQNQIREDDEFKIIINGNENKKLILTKELNKKILEENLICQVKLNRNKIEFLDKNNSLIRTKELEILNSLNFKIDVEIIPLDFSKRNKSLLPSRFISPDNKTRVLVYVNGSLFDNSSLYDLELLSSSKTTDTIRQQVGYVSIYAMDIEFNSDRTQFKESDISEEIESVIKEINKAIQVEASAIRKQAKNNKNEMVVESSSSSEDLSKKQTIRVPQHDKQNFDSPGGFNTNHLNSNPYEEQEPEMLPNTSNSKSKRKNNDYDRETTLYNIVGKGFKLENHSNKFKTFIHGFSELKNKNITTIKENKTDYLYLNSVLLRIFLESLSREIYQKIKSDEFEASNIESSKSFNNTFINNKKLLPITKALEIFNTKTYNENFCKKICEAANATAHGNGALSADSLREYGKFCDLLVEKFIEKLEKQIDNEQIIQND